MILQEVFTQLLRNYSNADTAHSCWAEIMTQYNAPMRKYHNTAHLQQLLDQLLPLQRHLSDWNSILFAICYHDIVYDPLQHDNEAQSALWAQKSLRQSGVPENTIAQCTRLIAATGLHKPTRDNDTNYFTDADLSVLGQPWPVYETYYKAIRQEYSCYPDIAYNPGRQHVLFHFLSMKHIYKTDYFREQLEAQARKNIKRESELYTSAPGVKGL